MNSYSRVFDPDYYYNTYPDLQTAIGTDKLALFTHFYNSGMAEGRKGCAEFDVNVYKENNTDLQTAFGSDLRKYYEHYMNTGWAEGRTHCCFLDFDGELQKKVNGTTHILAKK